MTGGSDRHSGDALMFMRAVTEMQRPGGAG